MFYLFIKCTFKNILNFIINIMRKQSEQFKVKSGMIQLTIIAEFLSFSTIDI